MRDSKAALDLLFRRTKRLADYENETKNLDKARQKHKDEKQAEAAQQLAKQKFEDISDIARNGNLALFCYIRFRSAQHINVCSNYFRTIRFQSETKCNV